MTADPSSSFTNLPPYCCRVWRGVERVRRRSTARSDMGKETTLRAPYASRVPSRRDLQSVPCGLQPAHKPGRRRTEGGNGGVEDRGQRTDGAGGLKRRRPRGGPNLRLLTWRCTVRFPRRVLSDIGVCQFLADRGVMIRPVHIRRPGLGRDKPDRGGPRRNRRNLRRCNAAKENQDCCDVRPYNPCRHEAISCTRF